MFLTPDVISCCLSIVLGLVVGLERAVHHKQASVRTFSLISLASCIFTLLSATTGGDIGRIAAQIVTGVGFVGGGIIFKSADRIEGITTAGLVWFTASLGMACGFHHYSLALLGGLGYVAIMILGKALHKIIDFFETKAQTIDKHSNK